MAKVTLQGNVINTCGELPEIGSVAPDFSLVDSRLLDVSLASFAGKKKLVSVVPSLDTPTCQTSTRKFNQKARRYGDTVILVVSADLPFAQARVCESEGLGDVVPLSTMRSTFGRDYGVEIVDGPIAGLTARAIIVLDEADRVVYTELVPEVAEEPDYERALAALD